MESILYEKHPADRGLRGPVSGGGAGGYAPANSPPADAPQSPPHGEGLFKRWDTNGDGVISRDEAQAAGAEHIAKMFDKLDLNKDGMITQDELRQAHQERLAAMKERFEAQFKAADKNGDGTLSKEEAAALPMIAKHFDEIDANHDGQVSLDELRAHHRRGHGSWQGGQGAPAPQQQ